MLLPYSMHIVGDLSNTSTLTGALERHLSCLEPLIGNPEH